MERVNTVQLPAAEGQVNRTGPIRAPVLAASPGKLIDRTEHQAIVLVNIGAPPLTMEVGVKLRLADIQIAAGVLDQAKEPRNWKPRVRRR